MIQVAGFLVLLAGLVFTAALLGVPRLWVGLIACLLVALAVLTGLSRMHRPDPPAN